MTPRSCKSSSSEAEFQDSLFQRDGNQRIGLDASIQPSQVTGGSTRQSSEKPLDCITISPVTALASAAIPRFSVPSIPTAESKNRKSSPLRSHPTAPNPYSRPTCSIAFPSREKIHTPRPSDPRPASPCTCECRHAPHETALPFRS